jgi:polyphosphate kinase
VAFRVTRNADVEVEEDRDEDLLQAIERSSPAALRPGRCGSRWPPVDGRRARAAPVRELDDRPTDDVYEVSGSARSPRDLMQLVRPRPPGAQGRPVRAPVHPRLVEGEKASDVFAEILRAATSWCTTRTTRSPPACSASSSRPRPTRAVLAIKQTLYRTSATRRSSTRSSRPPSAASRSSSWSRSRRASTSRPTSSGRGAGAAGVPRRVRLVGLKTHCKTAWSCGARRGCAATPTSAPATTTPRPPACTPTSGCSPPTRRSAPTSPTCSTSHRLLRPRALEPLLVAPHSAARRLLERILRRGGHARAGRPASIVAKLNAHRRRR